MTKRSIHIRVGKLFLKEVFDMFKTMVSSIKSHNKKHRLNDTDYQILTDFDKMFPTNKSPKYFFGQFYTTRLMKPGRQVIKENGKERISRYVSIFGHLRTLFLGVLSGDPRVGFLSKRVYKYKKTKEVVDIFDEFIKLYRQIKGFNKSIIPKHILKSANAFSDCESKPKNLCFPPSCEYIHHTRRTKGYCRTKKTRKNKKNKD